LLSLSNLAGELKAGLKMNVLMAVILFVALSELFWLQPHMDTLRQAMAGLQGDELANMRADFGNLHAVSSVLYSIKMIGALAWGLGRFSVKPTVS
jgi:hypothetical protein